MKIVIISDVHSNLEALETILNVKEVRSADKIVCLGDLVGYNANPNECIEKIRQLNVTCIAGNHDWGVIDKLSPKWFNNPARKAIEWTRLTLKPENMKFLKDLPSTLVDDEHKYIMVHGSIEHQFDYLNDVNLLRKNDLFMKENFPNLKICFFGHTHIPLIYTSDTWEHPIPNRIYKLDMDNSNYFINPGSVGQPRGGITTSARCIIYDTDKYEILPIEAFYNIDKTSDEILKAGLPSFLSERLYKGI